MEPLRSLEFFQSNLALPHGRVLLLILHDFPLALI
jgi:hypothetical protein